MKSHVVEITEVTESTDVELTEVPDGEQRGHNPLPARVRLDTEKHTKPSLDQSSESYLHIL